MGISTEDFMRALDGKLGRRRRRAMSSSTSTPVSCIASWATTPALTTGCRRAALP